MPEIAMIAALEREVWPLVRHWRTTDREYSGRRYRFFENENCVAVCGGIGSEAARRATEAAITFYKPQAVWSVGFAGALEERMRVGELLEARCVVDASDGSRVDVANGDGVLVSFSFVADEEQKSRLAKAYGGQAVDMEAASVARGAQAHGLSFAAVKVISDEAGFPMSSMERFTGKDGKFRVASFALYGVLRPWLWGTVMRLARNSAEAARVLCEHLNQSVSRKRMDELSISQEAMKDSIR